MNGDSNDRYSDDRLVGTVDHLPGTTDLITEVRSLIVEVKALRDEQRSLRDIFNAAMHDIKEHGLMSLLSPRKKK